jgi:hypothetical protein
MNSTMQSSIVRTSLVSASKQQVSCDLQDEVVILNLANGEYYGLNPVGARVWELIQEPRSFGEICDILIAEYEGAQLDEVARGVQALLEDMENESLVEVSRP